MSPACGKGIQRSQRSKKQQSCPFSNSWRLNFQASKQQEEETTGSPNPQSMPKPIEPPPPSSQSDSSAIEQQDSFFELGSFDDSNGSTITDTLTLDLVVLVNESFVHEQMQSLGPRATIEQKPTLPTILPKPQFWVLPQVKTTKFVKNVGKRALEDQVEPAAKSVRSENTSPSGGAEWDLVVRDIGKWAKRANPTNEVGAMLPDDLLRSLSLLDSGENQNYIPKKPHTVIVGQRAVNAEIHIFASL